MFVDIGVGVILLIGFIIGLFRGTAKSLLKLISIVAGAILTWRLTPYVMKFVFETDLFSQLIYGEGLSLLKLFEGVDTSFAADSIVLKVVCEPLIEYAINSGAGVQAIPYLLATFSAVVLVSFIVYLVVRLLIMIAVAIIKGIFINYEPNKFSRFIGGLIGIINGALVSLIILILSSSVVALPAISGAISEQTESSYVVNYAYEFVLDNYSKYMIEEQHLEDIDYLQNAIDASR